MGQTERVEQVVRTSGGAVEVVSEGGPGEAVLYLHGGHESAATAVASSLYTGLGYRVVRPSRPGYGRTDVGGLSPAAFAPLVDEVRDRLGYERFRAVVGTSFGGPQAIEYAGRFPARTASLVLHSAGPSTLPYPDSALERLLAPVVFHPRVERFTWGAVHLLIRAAPERGLRVMAASLSTRPGSSWLSELDEAGRREVRDVFTSMRSGRGFAVDLRFARAALGDARRRAQRQVACPALVTGSREDGGVSWRHAEDLASTVPGARLLETSAPSHLFWIGPGRDGLVEALRAFLDQVPR